MMSGVLLYAFAGALPGGLSNPWRALLVGAVIGGLTSLPGAILGAIVIQFMPMLTEQVSQSASRAVYGVIVIVAMYVMPFGLAGGFARVAGFVRSRAGGRSSQ